MDYAQRIDTTYQLTVKKATFGYYDSRGEPLAALNTQHVFHGGFIKFSQNGQVMSVSANAAIKSRVWLQFGNRIKAAFTVSRDYGLIAKHVDLPGGTIPRPEQNIHTAIIVYLSEEHHPYEGTITWTRQDTGQLDTANWYKRSTTHRVYLPEAISVMYAHLRNQERLGQRTETVHTYQIR